MKRALLSVSDKTGIVDFARELISIGYEVVSTGGTKSALEEAKLPVTAVEDVTGFPEILGGRVKTLNPYIHGGLLARREQAEDVATLKKLHIQPIDLVCVNLYPFKETISDPQTTFSDAIENIDIGGPSMLRAAAKNYQDVTVICDVADYSSVISELKENGTTSLEQRAHLAAKVFENTAAYDALIAKYLADKTGSEMPQKLTKTYELKQTMRYGENSHQKAWEYVDPIASSYSLSSAKQLHGKELSYNNIKDANAAISAMREFAKPTVIAMKHMSPCGIGQGNDLLEAWKRAYDADSISIFGGVIVLNRTVDVATAQKMHELFLEIIIAPGYEDEAFEILAKKKNIRLLQMDMSRRDTDDQKEIISFLGGVLVQEQDILTEDPHEWKTVTAKAPTEKQLQTMLFAWKAVKHTKSNAIVVAGPDQTLGSGAGQPNRIDSTKIAIKHAADKIDDNTVLASDAFFPMDDCVQYAAKHGITAIVQPGGSIRDQDSIDMANKYGITMVTTGIRHFRH